MHLMATGGNKFPVCIEHERAQKGNQVRGLGVLCRKKVRMLLRGDSAFMMIYPVCDGQL